MTKPDGVDMAGGDRDHRQEHRPERGKQRHPDASLSDEPGAQRLDDAQEERRAEQVRDKGQPRGADFVAEGEPAEAAGDD
jgi:hypothetical protein